MNRTISSVFWIGLYLLVVLVPVFLMLVPPVPSGRGFWLEFSVALGFVGLTQIAVQFVLIARFKRVTVPYGIDVILQYHRQIAMLAVLLIFAHPLIIVIDNPSRLKLLNPLGGNWASRAGWMSVLSLLAIAVTSIFRERLKITYEWWRLSHLLLGVSAIIFAQLHVSLAGLYTNTPWKQAFWITSAAAMVGLVIYLRLIKPAWQRGHPWRIADVREDRGDTFIVTLEAVDHPGLKFIPGQFAWLKIGDNPFNLEEHPFSFCSSSERQLRVEFGIKKLGDFTGRVDQLKIDEAAYLDGPHGAFSIDRYAATGYVFVAGGIGITPFMSFLRTMADRKDPRPVLLIYADERWDHIAFRDELDRLRESLDLTVHYVLREAHENWKGVTGYVDRDVITQLVPRERYERAFFICGPAPMMKGVHDDLLHLGVAETHIQMENFNLA